jgi:futalosine hydrolase
MAQPAESRHGDPGESRPILIVAAVDAELAPLEELVDSRRMGVVEFAATGVGKAAAGIVVERCIARLDPRIVLQVGCGGGFAAEGVRVGDIAVATLEIFADEGRESPSGFRTLGELGLASATRDDGATVAHEIPLAGIDADSVAALASRLATGTRVHTGPFLTVSTVTTSDVRAAGHSARWSPVCESMEGAAAALACWHHRIPMVEIRGISNLVGHRASEPWDLPRAVRHAASFAALWLESGAAPAERLAPRRRRSRR